MQKEAGMQQNFGERKTKHEDALFFYIHTRPLRERKIVYCQDHRLSNKTDQTHFLLSQFQPRYALSLDLR